MFLGDSRHWRRALSVVVAGALAALLSSFVVATPAFADPTSLFSLVTSVDKPTVTPGQIFTYKYEVSCSPEDCPAATLVNHLPDEFDDLILSPNVVITNPAGGSSDYAWGGTDGRELTVRFTQPLAGGSTGIVGGSGYSVQVSMTVPANLSPDWDYNDVAVPNLWEVSSTNAPTAQQSVDVTVHIPYVVDTTASATWNPTGAQFRIGATSALTLTTRNTSNALADSLTLVAPTDPTGTTPATNYFEAMELVSLDSVVFPQGADRVQVDAFVAGAWVTGSPAGTPALPAGVIAASVTGLRFIFTSTAGTTLAPNGTTGSAIFTLKQRATLRTAGTSLVVGATAHATVTGTVVVAGQTPVSKQASGDYVITALDSKVSGSTGFVPSRIPAGTKSTVTVVGQNASNGKLLTLSVTEPVTGSVLGDYVIFDGFTSAGAQWPSGATSAVVTWSVDSGSPLADSSFTSGSGFPATPTLDPGQRITGFVVTYSGDIAVGASAKVPFRVAVAGDILNVGEASRTIYDKPKVDGYNDAGAAATVTPQGSLVVLAPSVSVTLDKTVTPTLAIPAGGRSIVQLSARTDLDTAFVAPSTITIIDTLLGGADARPDDYWLAFDAVAIAPTSVPMGSTLTISYTTDGTSWVDLPVVDATAAPTTYSGALPSPTSSIQGLRFVFQNASGFGQGTVVKPAIAFQARSVLRGGSDPTATVGSPVTYTNTSIVDAAGTYDLHGVATTIHATATDTGTGIIKAMSGSGSGVLFDKAWQSSSLFSQSGASATARLSWGVEVGGYSSAVVSDTDSTSTAVSDTVFQAFNLVIIGAITPSTDPLIAFDQVTSVQIYNGTTWSTVGTCTTNPTTNPCRGTFPGVSLDTTQQGTTVGVRMTFAAWDGGRANDPLAPPVGSGIASGPDSRAINLVFQLRNQVRSPASPVGWVTAQRAYNNTDLGSVLNTAGISLTSSAGTTTATDSDAILILDDSPNLTLTKTVGVSALTIPNPGDVAESGYPTSSYNLKATNTSNARTWFLRVTDVMPCDTPANCVHNSSGPAKGYDVPPFDGVSYDPSSNPFERFNISKLTFTSSSGSGVDLSKSVVTLWKFVAATSTLPATTATTTLAANSGSLALASTFTDVIGFSVLYTGTNSTATSPPGGEIAGGAWANVKVDVTLRKFLRSATITLVTPTTVSNTAFGQVWDNVLPDTSLYSAPPAVNITFNNAIVRVNATKTLSPTTVLEANRSVDITATLSATDNSSTASTREVVLDDTGTAFWDSFEFRSLGTVVKPTGAEYVRVDVQKNGSSTWTTGTAATTAALPSGTVASEITGIRFVFTDSAGLVFSNTTTVNWTASAAFVVRVRSVLKSTSGSVPFPSTVSTTVVATSTNDALPVATSSGATSIFLDPGTFKLDVEKRPSVTTTPAGEIVDFSLVFTNKGTGYIDNPVVVDSLPIDAGLTAGGPLLYDPTSDPTYSTSSGGILPVTGITVSYNPTTRKVTFAWPVGARMAPGEKFTIVLPLQVAPGLLSSYGPATNTMTVSSDRTLSACTNTSGNGRPVTQNGDTKTCSTNNAVTTVSASAISSFKGVKGNVDSANVSTSGASNVNNAATACTPDSQGFYRSPCAANTVIGGTDLWKLQFTNGGNIPATTATIVDVLPKSGDSYLRTGSGRGSAYAPVFAGGLTLATDSLSAGTTFRWEITTDSNPCPSFGANAAGSTCSSATWVNGDTYSGNYALVKGIRVTFDFSALSGGTLPPAATLNVTYTTVNTPSTSGGDGRAPVSVPVTNARAWNSFGVYAEFASSAARSVEPVKAGVQLATGPIQVTKAIVGTTAAYAPTSYLVTVSCTVQGATVSLPSSGQLTLAATNATPYSARIDGIPVGAVCRVVENTTGSSSVSYSPAAASGPAAAELTIAQAGISTAAVPVDQQVTVTNSYGTTELLVTKAVTTTTTVGSFGPFAFTLACTVNNGTTTLTVPLASADAAFSLLAGEQHLIQGLPVTAACALRESDSGGASSISVKVGSASAVTVAQNAPVTITLGTAAQYTAAVTNTFAGGKLSLAKIIAGAGGSDYGTGSFTIHVLCTYHSQTLYDADVSVTGGQTVGLSPVFPVGTSCVIAETDNGGATTNTAPGSVLIPAPAGGATYGAVTASVTNTFSVGTLRVEKSITGAGKATYGEGPFQAQVTCTWVKRAGSPALTIPLPGSGLVSLTKGNGYAASISGLIAGASCSVLETATGGATTVTVGAMSPSTVPSGGTSTVTITNDFATGSFTVIKDRIGAGVSRFGAGPFTIAVACEHLVDGTMTPIDLHADATQVLQADADPTKNFRATIDGLIAGASCTATETNAGLAVSSTRTPTDGTATVMASGSGTAASVTITNTFLIGQLQIVKTASQPVVQGDTDFDYSFAVSNVGPVDAAGVTVTDPIPATLAVTAITVDPLLWSSCAVAGEDSDGYGGQLECVYAPVLLVGQSAAAISISVHVLPAIATDTILNTATVTSTTPVVDGDIDDETVDVKWLDVTATPTCVKDAPWLDYTVDAHNVDVAGKTTTVTWADKNGVVIHTDTVPITSNGPVTGRLIWPGAAVDSNDEGIAWPGWRDALPGETPDWENLVLDPLAYGYGLRSDAQVTISINPTTTITVQYPPASSTCDETPVGRDADLWFTKKASVSTIQAGASFEYTLAGGNVGMGAVDEVVLTDPIPTSLRVVTVTPVVAATGDPVWTSCTVTARLASGYGGTITCELDRPLGPGQDTPDIVVGVQVSPTVPESTIVNTAYITATDISTVAGSTVTARGLSLPTFALQDSATVMTPGMLAFTGAVTAATIQLAVLLLLLGALFVLFGRRPRTRNAIAVPISPVAARATARRPSTSATAAGSARPPRTRAGRGRGLCRPGRGRRPSGGPIG